jgi:hypothetical protein
MTIARRFVISLIFLILILILVPSVSSAQNVDNQKNRKIWNVISYGTVITNVVLDTVHSARAENKKVAFERQGIAVGSTILASELVKHFVHETRPDGSDNKSLWSEHTGIAGASSGYNYSIGFSLTGATGLGRVKGKRHFVHDVVIGGLVGSGIRIATERFIK